MDPLRRGASAEQAPPPALYFDPESGRFLLDEGGALRALHPVDHAVAIAMGVELGALPSSPTVGNRLRKLLARAPRNARQTTATYAVREALSRLLERGDIALLGVEVDVRKRDIVTVRYANLRAGPHVHRTLQTR